MGKLRLILFLITNCIIFKSVNSQTIGGAEVYYDKLGQSTYKVTGIVYRNCSSSTLYGLNGYVIADTFKIPISFKRISITKIDDTCGNPCQNLNAIGNLGFEKHVFIDTVDFSRSTYDSIPNAGLCQVRFAIHQKLRNPGITTHLTHNDWLYIDAMVDICLPFTNVHSPRFGFEPKMLQRCYSYLNYTPGPIDTFDFDSLSFNLDTLQYDFLKNVTYSGSYNAQIPMTPYCPPNPLVINCRALPSAKPPRGFYFDKEVCQIGFTPTKCDEIGSIKFKVSEWRNDSNGTRRFIGYVSREMTLEILQLPDDNSPYRSGNNKFASCQNNKICFSQDFKDDPFLPFQTTYDTVHIDWDHGIPSATLILQDSNAREKRVEFCWDTKDKKAGRYVFGIKAIDKSCNSSLSTFGYYIQKYQPTDYSTQYNVDICNKITFKATPKYKGDSLYGIINMRLMNGSTLFDTYNTYDSFTVNYDGPIIIIYNLRSKLHPNCTITKIDTVIIKKPIYKPFEYNPIDTLVCFGAPSFIKFSPSKQSNIVYWEWFKDGTKINTTDTQINFKAAYLQEYKLTIYNNLGCSATAIRKYNTYKPSYILYNFKTPYCKGENAHLWLRFINNNFPYQSNWYFRGNWIMNSDSLKFTADRDEKLIYEMKDDNHCYFKDSINFIANPLPEFNIKPEFGDYCKDSIVNIKITDKYIVSPPYTISYYLNKTEDFTYKNKESINVKVFDSTQIIVKIADKHNCGGTDSIYLQPPYTPNSTLNDSGSYCNGDSIKITFHSNIQQDGYNIKALLWYINGFYQNIKDTFIYLRPTGNWQVKASVKSSNNCDFELVKQLAPFPLTTDFILTDTIYNKAHFIHLSTDKAYDSYNWFNGVQTRDNDFWAYTLGAPGKYSIWCEVTDSNGCVGRHELKIRTNGLTDLDKMDKSSFTFYPNPANSELTVTSSVQTNMEIFDLDGKLLISKSLESGINTINLESLASGVYNLKVDGNAYKLVVVR